MQFFTVRELRSQSADVWRRLADEGDIVVTSNGKPIAVLSAVAPDNLEKSLRALRRARALAAVETIQRQSLRRGKHRISAKQILAEIATVRRARRK